MKNRQKKAAEQLFASVTKHLRTVKTRVDVKHGPVPTFFRLVADIKFKMQHFPGVNVM